jgi:hypothetical protein
VAEAHTQARAPAAVVAAPVPAAAWELSSVTQRVLIEHP